MMIRGFDAAVADMEVGQIVDIHLTPEEAYGQPDPNAIFTIEPRSFPVPRIWKWASRYIFPTRWTAFPG